MPDEDSSFGNVLHFASFAAASELTALRAVPSLLRQVKVALSHGWPGMSGNA